MSDQETRRFSDKPLEGNKSKLLSEITTTVKEEKEQKSTFSSVTAAYEELDRLLESQGMPMDNTSRLQGTRDMMRPLEESDGLVLVQRLAQLKPDTLISRYSEERWSDTMNRIIEDFTPKSGAARDLLNKIAKTIGVGRKPHMEASIGILGVDEDSSMTAEDIRLSCSSAESRFTAIIRRQGIQLTIRNGTEVHGGTVSYSPKSYGVVENALDEVTDFRRNFPPATSNNTSE